jgi:hypothetical protein
MVGREKKVNLVSIIIVNLNGRKFLEECLRAISQQTYRNYEVIFVDNGSTDDSTKFVEENYPQVKIIRLTHNMGFAEGANIGIKASKGDYIFLLNNDVVLDEKCLELLSRTFEEYPSFSSCGPKIIRYNNRGRIDSAGIEFLPIGAVHSYYDSSVNEPRLNRTKETFGISAAAGMYKKVMMEEIGFFDEDFFAYFEDTDLSFRAQLMGYKCLYQPLAVAYHHGSGTGIKNSPFYVYFGRRNVEFLYFKNMPTKLLLKYGLWHIFYEILVLTFFIMYGKGSSAIKGKIDAVTNIAMIIKKRRIIQNNRKVSCEYIENLFYKREGTKTKFKKAFTLLKNRRK